MRLVELFDNPVTIRRSLHGPPVKKEGGTKRVDRHEFKVKGIPYVLQLVHAHPEVLKKELTVPQKVLDAGGMTLGVDFNYGPEMEVEWKPVERLGKKTELLVFATVINKVKEELRRNPQIRTVHLGAISVDEPRKNLYLRMVRKLLPQAEIIEVPNQPATGTDYTQTRIFAVL